MLNQIRGLNEGGAIEEETWPFIYVVNSMFIIRVINLEMAWQS